MFLYRGGLGVPAVYPLFNAIPRRNGSRRTRLPVSAKYALATAGAIGGTPGSPTPIGAADERTMCRSMLGMSSIRSGMYGIFKRPFSSGVKVLRNLRGVNHTCPLRRLSHLNRYWVALNTNARTIPGLNVTP